MSCQQRKEREAQSFPQATFGLIPKQAAQADVSQLPPVLPLSLTSPDLDSGAALASPALSLRVKVYEYWQTAGCFTWSVYPRRLVVAVKDTRTQLCQPSHTREENKCGQGQVSDLSPGFWQVSCYLV